MSVPFTPSGAWTALVTPFDASGQLNTEAFRALVEFQIGQGINGLVPVGTTGESPTLSWDEHILVLESAVQAARGRVGVLAGTGSNATEEAVAGTRHAREAGASAALLVDCYYNGPSSLELRTEYYERVLADVAEIPVVPYVIPGRTGCALSAEDLAMLHRAAPARVPAVKEATGDLERMRRDREVGGPSLAILSGDDDLTLTMMQDARIGASGVISVMSNLAPAAVSRMVAKQRSGDTATADGLCAALAPLFRLVGCKARSERQLPGGDRVSVEDKFRNPLPVKTMMAGLGMQVGGCRRPLGRMTRPAIEQCREALRQVHKAAPEILNPIGEAFGVNVERRIEDSAAWAPLTRSSLG
jgi:4-hydroxy-tetrahydrodipicolinate synthase